MDFIYELYQNDNFVIYLTIALVILIILFVVVLFLGKRDKKLEETRKLQKIELNGFKEEKKDDVKLEVPVNEKVEELPKVEEKSIVELTMDTANESDVVMMEDKNTDDINVVTFEPEKTIVNEEVKEETIDDLNLEKDLNDLESIRKEFDSIELPEIKKEDPKIEVKKENKYKAGPQIFSSVFVNKEKEPENSIVEETKTEIKPEIKIEDNKKRDIPKVNLFSIEDDEEEIELPSLKEETKEEKTVIFNDIEGETYKVNK